MAKQNDTLLGSLNGALGEGAEKLKETAKEVANKVKTAAEPAGQAVKAATKTAADAAKKTKVKAEKAGKELEEAVKTEEENVKKAAEHVVKEEKAAAKRGRKAVKTAEKQVKEAVKTATLSKNMKTKVIAQFDGVDIDVDAVYKKAEKAAQKACRDHAVKTLEVYINCNQKRAYYVVNGEGGDTYFVEL